MTKARKMSPTGSKNKGAGYERDCARALSLWITGGVRDDTIWRSAASGAAATRRVRDGKDAGVHVGDLISVASESDSFFRSFCVECKRPRSLDWRGLFVQDTKSSNILEFWDQASKQGSMSGKIPMLMMRENSGAELLGLPLYMLAGLERSLIPFPAKVVCGDLLIVNRADVFASVVPLYMEFMRRYSREQYVNAQRFDNIRPAPDR